jgi:TolB protein
VALALGGSSAAAGAEGLIAFSRSLDGGGRIYAMRGDGSGLRLLTPAPGNDFPEWSPDGTRIAFVNGGGVETTEILVVGLDGAPPRRLTRGPGFDGSPAWSPDGRRIAWAAERAGDLEVWVMDATGAHPRRLTRDGGAHPRWSPDGRRLVYVNPTDGALDVVDADGGRPRRLTPRPASAGPSGPAWSPDGRRIAFVGADGRLYVVAARGGAARRVTAPGRTGAFPAWSSSGRGLAFLDARTGALLAWDARAGQARRLVAHTDGMSPPAWSPDGARVAFGDASGHIAVVGQDGRGLLRLTHGREADDHPAWAAGPRRRG